MRPVLLYIPPALTCHTLSRYARRSRKGYLANVFSPEVGTHRCNVEDVVQWKPHVSGALHGVDMCACGILTSKTLRSGYSCTTSPT